MKDFLLIFRDTLESTQAYAQLSPQELQADMEHWNSWMAQLAQQGRIVGGQPLLPEGKVLRGPAAKLTDGPYIEAKDIVSGYLILKAHTLAEATELSKGCPILSSEAGTVEVRELMPLPA